jgi:hypothetical protein
MEVLQMPQLFSSGLLSLEPESKTEILARSMNTRKFAGKCAMPAKRYTVLLFMTLLCTTSRVTGTSLLDQQQPTIDTTGMLAIGGNSAQKLAQVVTAGISGFLTEVRLPVSCDSASNLIVEIQGVTAGTPNGSVLTSQTIPGSSLPPTTPGFQGLALSTPAFFSSGSQFAIVLRSAGACGVYRGPVGNSYAGGNLYFDAVENLPLGWVCVCVFAGDRFDLPFQTLVEPPVTFQSTQNDIASLNNSGQIDNVGIAKALSHQILAAMNLTGADRIAALNDFKDFVNAQTGKHISAAAAQTLINDVNALLASP